MKSFPLCNNLTAKVPPERMLAAARMGGGQENDVSGPVRVLLIRKACSLHLN